MPEPKAQVNLLMRMQQSLLRKISYTFSYHMSNLGKPIAAIAGKLASLQFLGENKGHLN